MTATEEACVVPTPVGRLRIRASGSSVIAVDWSPDEPDAPRSGVLSEAARQMEAYFSGRLQRFDLALSPAGTDHDRAVWAAMRAIPYGEVRTYGAIAAQIGSSPRAVGAACARNPIPVIIPCHRIVAAGRQLGGYSGQGGLSTKQTLLALEGYPRRMQEELFTDGSRVVAGRGVAR